MCFLLSNSIIDFCLHFTMQILLQYRAHAPLLKSRHYFFSYILLIVILFWLFSSAFYTICSAFLVCYSRFNIIYLSSTLEFTYKNAFPFHLQSSSVNCEKRKKKGWDNIIISTFRALVKPIDLDFLQKLFYKFPYWRF